MALALGSLRPALFRLVLISWALLSGCDGCNDASSASDAGQDASVDAGDAEVGPDLDPIPGVRPTLSAPGEIVPLLWGRVVEARDELSGTDERLALDDPTQPLYQRFFGALNAACTAELAAEVSPPVGDLVLPGCGQDGAYRARLHLCRAEAASAFVAGDGAGLVGPQSQPRLSLSEYSNPGDPLWSTQSKENLVRASWAMLSVAELREAIATASDALDPESCEALSDEHAPLLAKALRDASELLAARTQSAAGLLQQARLDLHKDESDDADTRIRVTRALNHSLLEQQKLYTGVPYALFSPLEPTEENARSDRYPVLFDAEDAPAERAATLLLVSHSRLFDEASNPLAGEALGSAFADAIRAYEPKLFGSHGAGDGPAVLGRLGLSVEDLDAGARLLVQRLQLSGAPIAYEVSLDVPGGLAQLYGSERAPAAYVEAITGARATRVDDKPSSYARRGLHHALEAARLAAQRALERNALPSTAETDLSFVAAGSDGLLGSLWMCVGPSTATLELRVPNGIDTRDFEFWRGELGAACAVDPSCDAEPYRAPDASEGEPGLELSDEVPQGRFYVTRKGPGETRTLVAGVSTALLDESQGERCYFVPLTSDMHASMRGLHDRDPSPQVPRTLPPLTLGSDLVATDTAAVTTAYGRTLGGKDALGADLTLDLGEPLSSASLALNQALDAKCGASDALTASTEMRECGPGGLVRAEQVACRAETLSAAAGGSSLTLPGLSLLFFSEAERLSLQLKAWDEAHRAMAVLADLFDAERCNAQNMNAQAKADALDLLSELVVATEADLPLLTAALETEADAKAAAQNDPYRRRVDRVRALTGSSLASARLLLSPPLAAYEASDGLGLLSDPFDFALSRFPVVTRDAELAEDARAESLLRTSRVQPWLADLTVQDGRLDLNAVESALNGPELAKRLRAALVALDAEAYGALPTDAYGFLQALGIDNTQLRNAAVRIAQTAEIRGLSLLPETGTSPLTAVAMGASFPPPQGQALSALAGGKLAAAESALPHHFALRGHYHTLAYVKGALLRAQGLPSAGATLLSTLANQVEDQIVIEQTGDSAASLSFAVEVTVDGTISDQDALARYRLVFTDTGLACSLTGSAGGEACQGDEYTTEADSVSTLWGADGSTRRLRLSGFLGYSETHTRELGEGRIYLLAGDGATAVAASASIAPLGRVVRHVVPRSSAFEQRVLELLAFRAPGEGCAACRPRSVCETTRCQLDVCIREAEPNGKTCGLSALCEEGECSAPGCGDGARADGTGDVAYEACDDGNLTDDDGCSSACFPELRSLEPVIEEGFPAGPATAIGVDGLGQQLLVYTADALVGDNQLIRAAVLDSFGVLSGSERTLDAAIPRVFIAEPCVAGLRDGGFAVVYGSPNIDGKAGIGVRIVGSEGSVGALLRVDDGNATAGTARVATVEDGFVVVWSERTGNALTSRVRVRRFDAQGAAIGPSFAAAAAGVDVDQVEPNVISSLGQLLVVWSERDASASTGLGIHGRRFFPFGSPVDADSFSISSGDDSQPALTVLSNDDYLVAFTSRDGDRSGDVMRRTLQRFGLPLAAGEVEPWIVSDKAESGPVIAALGSDAVLAYQAGAPLPITALSAETADADASDSLAFALASARERDVSAFSTPLGVWFVWSARQAQGRALFAYLLPAGQ